MKQFIADLHIHIGRAGNGKSVKITASRNLTFENIIDECLNRKGIDLTGIVDCASPSVIKDIKELIKKKKLTELPEGGFLHKDRVVILLGSEIETYEKESGFAHFLCYFPYLSQIVKFSNLMKKYISNIELSSQRCFLQASQLYSVVKEFGGILIPAHAFTPHKSVYGNMTDRLDKVFTMGEEIPAIELGLSADTFIADHLTELENISFLSNSDAHSLPKIGREYNIIEMQKCNFKEFVLALKGSGGRKIIANYGLDPKLGKYHRSFCEKCNFITDEPPPVLSCSKCFSSGKDFVSGVLDRVIQIKDKEKSISPAQRPVYNYQVCLEFVPGVGKVILDRLIKHFGSEMAVIHSASREELIKVVGVEVANMIILAREGRLILTSGGGGKFGKVSSVKNKNEQLTLL
ncbi:MAG: endonuclease Q family protein [Armatimonadota bacterium]